jgi:Dyp-type peroxidase family
MLVSTEVAEPVLNLANIQGNALVGFGSSYQVVLFFRITDGSAFKSWMKSWAAAVTPAAVLLDAATSGPFLNVAFTFEGLRLLSPEADLFQDDSFRAGMVSRSAALGDPTDRTSAGHPSQWKVVDGAEDGFGRVAHVVLLVAGEDDEAVNALARRLSRETAGASPAGFVRDVFPGQQWARKLPWLPWGAARGSREHFGYRDGISQPALRGLPSRSGAGQSPVWPGTFIFGYPRQPEVDGDDDVPGLVAKAGPSWGDDGSFLVLRRLRQDVGAFHRFITRVARTLETDAELDGDWLGSRLFGRWTSGASVVSAPAGDDPSISGDGARINAFNYAADDPQAWRCPFPAHTRRTFPRDDRLAPLAGSVDAITPAGTKRRRILRRGIPYGPASPSTPLAPVDDGVDRGMLFLAYMTSIVDQFEFVTMNWLNNPALRGSGYDLLVGQNGRPGEARRRWFSLAVPQKDGSVRQQTIHAVDERGEAIEWVVPTGGAYLFCPSLRAIRALCGE